MSDILENKITWLNEPAFNNYFNKVIFIIWLSKHDYIRQSFINKSDLGVAPFILEWTEKLGYELKIREDIKNKDLYDLAVFLEKELWLEYFWSIERFQNKIKILVWSLIKNNKLTVEEVKEILIENDIEIDDKLFDSKTNFTLAEIREVILQINQISWKSILNNWDYKKLSKNETKSVASNMLQQLIFTQVHNRWVDELWNIKTTTKRDIEKLHELHWYKKGINLDKYLDVDWLLRSDLFYSLWNNEENLRDVIWIDKFKKKLWKVRKNNNKEEIEKIELDCTNAIISYLYKHYPRNTINEHWSFTKEIKYNKEIHCVWFSLIWHRFLQELWIKHKWMSFKNHSALEINIWNKQYYFDATGLSKIIEFKYWTKKEGLYNEIILENLSLEIWYAKSWNTEDILQNQVYNNLRNYRYGNINKDILKKSIELNSTSFSNYANLADIYYNQWYNNEAIKLYKKCIELNEKYLYIYNNIWNILIKKWNEKLWGIFKFSYLLKEWSTKRLNLSEHNILDIYKIYKIRKLVKNKNFSGLKDYYFKLLEKEWF